MLNHFNPTPQIVVIQANVLIEERPSNLTIDRFDFKSHDLIMPESQRKITPREHTRQQLILAAEKLFAESGIDSVSLRQINLEAGQKNSSAAHYHFGSKDALILSIYQLF